MNDWMVAENEYTPFQYCYTATVPSVSCPFLAVLLLLAVCLVLRSSPPPVSFRSMIM